MATKTQLDLFEALLSEIGHPSPKLAVAELKQAVGIKFFGEKDEMSQEEFDAKLAQMRKELPAFLHSVMTSDFRNLPKRAPEQN